MPAAQIAQLGPFLHPELEFKGPQVKRERNLQELRLGFFFSQGANVFQAGCQPVADFQLCPLDINYLDTDSLARF